MIKLHRDPQSGWRYTQDNQYVIHKYHWFGKRKPTWDVKELAPDGSYRLINSFPTMKEAREFLEQLPIYKQ